jgi:uncharacterized membrane protein
MPFAGGGFELLCVQSNGRIRVNVELLVLRLLHIVPGVLWVGALFFTTNFLEPAVRAAGPAGAAVMPQLLARKLPLFMMSMAILTILSGARLMWIVSGGMNPLWTHAPMGRTLMIGATSALLGFIAGMAINMPAARRMGAIMAAGQAASAGAELGALQAKLRLGQRVTMALLGIALLCMALARYV